MQAALWSAKSSSLFTVIHPSSEGSMKSGLEGTSWVKHELGYQTLQGSTLSSAIDWQHHPKLSAVSTEK